METGATVEPRLGTCPMASVRPGPGCETFESGGESVSAVLSGRTGLTHPNQTLACLANFQGRSATTIISGCQGTFKMHPIQKQR
jgi:hypothetical protein